MLLTACHPPPCAQVSFHTCKLIRAEGGRLARVGSFRTYKPLKPLILVLDLFSRIQASLGCFVFSYLSLVLNEDALPMRALHF
mmetsp:Transcript_14921/g.12262  ORF Transcript_14921/g.12262 Transcript_14921/m.12262 type:complete len:83 (+) Transcript_14921:2138-2386(+)